MSAEVETMAFAGELPWHKLGVQIPDDLTPDEILVKAGLDWTVSKRGLAYGDRPLIDGDTDLGTINGAIAERFALCRDSDDQFLDIVGKTYRPTQNHDAFEFFDAFVKEAKLKMHTAGSLCSGKFVWALAETKKAFEIGPQKDRVESYILLVSPHQFGKALIAQQTTVRVVCQNTLNLALNEKGMVSYRMPHTRNFDKAAKYAAAQVLGLVSGSFSEFQEHVKSLAGTKINRSDLIDFYCDVLKIKQDVPDAANDDGLPDSRMLKQFMDAFEGGAPGADLSGSKGTLWGAVNAVTYVLDHVSVRDREKSLRDSFFGYRGDLKRKALKKAVLLAA